VKKIVFCGKKYKLIITKHAKTRMIMRGIDNIILRDIIETGFVKPKETKNKFWVFKKRQK